MPAKRHKAPAWAAGQVEHISVKKLAPNDHNSRRHPEDQVIQIADSIMAFGWTMPLLIDEANVLIAGEGRWKAAKLLLERGDMKSDLLPCLRATGWTEEQKRAYIIADNKLTMNGEWDMEMLGRELGDLEAAGFDLDLTGFSGDELADLIGGGGGDGSGDGDGAEEARTTLAERFGFVPFTVFSAREGRWQERKAAWIALGIESELGRGQNLVGRSLHDRLTQVMAGHYSDIRAFVDKQRKAGLSDEEILALAVRESGRAGANGSQRLAAGGGSLTDRMASGEGTKRKDAEAEKMIVRGKGWGDGGPARRDPAFYAKKRAKEAELGRDLTTEEFRENHWDPDAPAPKAAKRRKRKARAAEAAS